MTRPSRSVVSKNSDLKTSRTTEKSREKGKRGKEKKSTTTVSSDGSMIKILQVSRKEGMKERSGNHTASDLPDLTTGDGRITHELSKPKKTPRIRIVGSTPLPKDWADHGEQNSAHSDKIKIKITPKTFRLTSFDEQPRQEPQQETTPDIDSEEEHYEDESEDMSLDSDNEVIADLANRSALSKAPDHVHNMVAKWGKGTECVIEWGFRQDTVNYTSKGIVVGRTSRKGMVKVKISYNPAQGSKGPSGFLYLPHTNRIRICSIRATKLIKVETITRNLEEHADNVSSDENGQSDLEPLPTMVPIDSSFSIHVVAIFRAILRGYPSVELDSEKTAIWHKFLNAPRDSLATIRQLSRQNQRVGHINKQADPSENETLSIEQREELGVDRRSIKNALTTARAGNIGKATRILDNVYKVSNLTAHEKLQKLRDLHPEGPSIEIPEADFPRIGVVDKSELRLAVEKLARGASPGPSGLSESMMRLLVEDEEACLSLCHMIRDVINGDVPVSVRKRLTRCRIIALPKPQNGIRPVAMGETILKICGSILLERHECALRKYFSPMQRGVLHKSACESIVHELLQEYEDGCALITVDFTNAYNTPRRDAITQALLENPVFKPFMRLFYLEYGLSSELLFFAHNALFATIESSSGIRQGSSLSSMYFCALLHGPIREIASLYPDVKIRAYQDDVTLSSTNVPSLEAAFLHLREITGELNLRVNFQKCEFFQKNTTYEPFSLHNLGVKLCTDSIKILGAYIGKDKVVEDLLLRKLSKHKCLFRRLLLMGPSNLSLAILRRCTIPRQDYHLRVHRPEATRRLAHSFESHVHEVLQKWCGADAQALKLAAFPQKLGGLGLTSCTLKQQHYFAAARESIEEHLEPNKAPVDSQGNDKSKAKIQSRAEKARKSLKKIMSQAHEKQLTEIQKDSTAANIIKRTKEANIHLENTSNYVNPYLFRYTLMMRLGIGLPKAPAKVTCPGCSNQESPSTIIPHVAGCSRCSGMNSTRKHSHIVRYLSELCSKAGLPSVIEPRIYSSYHCTKCKCTISADVAAQHPCKARRIRSGPDLAIMWPHMGEVLYDFTIVHTCCSSYAKHTSSALMQQVSDRKYKKYVTEKGVDSDSFKCLAATDCGLLHDDTKALLKALSQRAKLKYESVRNAFQLEIEKMSAYTVVSQLRDYIPAEKWMSELRL